MNRSSRTFTHYQSLHYFPHDYTYKHLLMLDTRHFSSMHVFRYPFFFLSLRGRRGLGRRWPSIRSHLSVMDKGHVSLNTALLLRLERTSWLGTRVPNDTLTMGRCEMLL